MHGPIQQFDGPRIRSPDRRLGIYQGTKTRLRPSQRKPTATGERVLRITGATLSTLVALASGLTVLPGLLAAQDRPEPFASLDGVALNISLDSLRKVRPTAVADGTGDLAEQVHGFRLLYRFRGEYRADLQFHMSTLELVSAFRVADTGDHTRFALHKLLGDSGESPTCVKRTDNLQTLIWSARRIGQDEFIAVVFPETENQHRDGVITIPSQLALIWRPWQPDRENESSVQCPDAAQ